MRKQSAPNAFWDTLAQLDASHAADARREGEVSELEYRASDTTEAPKMPLRILQEISGRPIGFECVSPE